VLAGIVVSLLLVTRRVSLHSYVPFGPFLIVGALLAILRA
jgi:prepilin signal peptidase PulO-like enzyme (type II secretory pathway)